MLILKCIFVIIFLARPLLGDPFTAIKGNLEGLKVKGVPGKLLVFGKSSVPILTEKQNGKESILMAASEYERGKVIAITHEGFMHPSNLRWMEQSLSWLSQRKKDHFTIYTNQKNLVSKFRDKITIEYSSKIKGIKTDVWVIHSHQIKDMQEVEALRHHVSNGGGLLVSGLGWAWKIYFSKGQRLDRDFLGNKLLHHFGMAFIDGSVRAGNQGAFSFTDKAPVHLHLDEQLRKLEDKNSDLSQLEEAIRGLPLDQLAWTRELVKKIDQKTKQDLIDFKQPIKSHHTYQRLKVILQAKRMKVSDVNEVEAHASASHFPGMPKYGYELTSIEREIINIKPKFNSTGVYAVAGQVFELVVPDHVIGKVTCRIGSHSDKLYHLNSWKRFPEITIAQKITKKKTKLNSSFGGLIYLEFHKGFKDEELKVEFNNVIEAPLYLHGQTDLKSWKDKIRFFPGPWAEIGSDKVIVTVPSEMVRDLDQPDILMQRWNEVLDHCAELAQIPLERTRPERFVCDLQISAGYMHSGYPIMTWMDQKRNLVDVNNLVEGNWGFYHELGHNHQKPSWTFDGTGEVTCNLFSLYVFEKLCGIKPDQYKRTSGKIRDLRVKKYLKSPNLELWKTSPFLALDMYVMLQQEFGWAPFKKVFLDYQKIDKKLLPKSDREKIDQWMQRFSLTVQKDLSDFFIAWGFEFSSDVMQKVSHLPKWQPQEVKKILSL
jgi:hypothetical protein